MQQIDELRRILQKYELNGYIIPSTDEWRNEYTPLHTKRLEFISGFSGSNGMLIVTENDLILFTDSRYIIQAKNELASEYKILNMHEPNACDVMKLCRGVIGYDAMILTQKEVEYYEKLGSKFEFKLQAVQQNLVDLLKQNCCIQVEEILPDNASTLCHQFIQKLPEYFSISECNDAYIEGVKHRQNFAARIKNEYVGLISIDYHVPNNANIYWLGILPEFQNKGIGSALIQHVRQKNIKTLTVETLSPNENDEGYVKTYNFYLKQGFLPFFNLKPNSYKYDMIYMVKYNLFQTQKRFSHVSQVFSLPIEVTGKSVAEKMNEICIPESADCVLLTCPAAICWLLNIRGNDIPYNPITLCYAIIYTNKIQLFINTNELLKIDYENIEIYSLNEIESHILKFKNTTFAIDIKNTPIWFIHNIEKYTDIEDITLELRAIKNETELQGIKLAHLYDGIAICKFWFWLYVTLRSNTKIDEVIAADMLLKFRQENESFICESFNTISAYGANGAIVHYNQNQCKFIPEASADYIYLLDSGGQYSTAGTTDVTRVFDIGKLFGVNKYEHKRIYTLVLKGHIALASAIFPVGTTGSQIDVLARTHLWKSGLNYGHGTGHGVGHFSFVHEGPHSISSKNNISLKINMIVSIEPGYYKEGCFGMRIENLYVIKHSQYNGFLEFEPLTLVPIETSLIDFTLMTKNEIEWLQNYNKLAMNAVKNYLSSDEVEFLLQNIKTI